MNPKTPAPQHSDDKDADGDLVAILDILVENRWSIIAIVCAFLLLGTAYAFLAKPVYEADIMVQVEDSPDTSAAKSLLGDVSALFDVKSSAAAESQILASRLVVSRAVDDLNLYIYAKPRRFPLIGQLIARHNDGQSDPGLLGFGGFAWGRERIDVPVFNVPTKIEGDAFQLILLDAQRYRLSGSDLVNDVEGTIGKLERFSSVSGPIELRVAAVTAKPGTAFRLIRNSRLQTIEDLQDHLDVQEKVKQSDVVVATLQDTDPQWLADALNEIGRQYIRQNIERKSAEAAQSLDFLNEQLPKLKSQLNDSEERLTKLRDARGTVDLTEEAKLALAQSADAQTRLLELQQKRQELLSHFTGTHPSIAALDQQIASLAAYRDAAEKQIRRLPDVQQDSVRLMLDVKVNTDLYTALLDNMQQLQLVRAGKVGNVRLVDTAAVPEIPVKPKKPLVMAASLLLGVLVGCGWAIARSFLFNGVSDPGEIERRLGLSVFATVPLSEKQKALTQQAQRREQSLSLLAHSAPGDPAVESLRSLRTALQFAMLEARNNVVIIAGPAPGVGKTFVSANLAAVLAMGGKRVLLIDGDLRKGRLNEYLGLRRENGFSEAIAGIVPVAGVIHRGVIDGFDFIATGAIAMNPAELLLSPRVPALIEELSSGYDIVIIDSAPVLAVSDTGILAAAAGTALLIALSGVTKLGEVAESAKRFTQNGVKLSGVVFNGINPRLGQYGYGSKYGGYRYVSYEYGNHHDA
ncbi:polysaccharide biosynthesis tyrosine autokinase [Paraburkholderia sediminicola]|uniref:polysaccharide biosynthesis tyrosine autokinase n=1 Tax=Paraburkholderia sediminicola TaxID=458836 RepID=UPI0038BCBEF7